MHRGTANAAGAPSAKEVFQKAVERQGRVDPGNMRDVHVSVTQGRIQRTEKGKTTQNRIQSDFWYRTADRAFRIKLQSRTDAKMASERSVIGRKYYERTNKVIELKPGNELDLESIGQVKEKRDHFENVLGLMLLGRLDVAGTRFAFAADEPVTLAAEMPLNERMFRPDPKARHHVVDVLRKDRETLRLFIDTTSFEVKKAEIFARPSGAKTKDNAHRIYYFGKQTREPALSVSHPGSFIEYSRVPEDENTKRDAWTLMGVLNVKINGGLADDVFILTNPKQKR